MWAPRGQLWPKRSERKENSFSWGSSTRSGPAPGYAETGEPFRQRPTAFAASLSTASGSWLPACRRKQSQAGYVLLELAED
jgi:hypothetical protein